MKLLRYFFAIFAFACFVSCHRGTTVIITEGDCLDPMNTNVALAQTPAQIKYSTPANKEITAGILSVSADKMYCVIYPQDAKEFLPDVTNDDNPIVIIAKLK